MFMTVPLAGFVIDIIITSLPAIKKAFEIDTHLAQFVFTFCVLGFGVGQLFSGFIVDALARKKVLLSAIVVLVLLLGISIYIQNIYLFIAIRFLQGIAISFVAVAARAVIRDIHTDTEYKNAVNYLTIGFAFALTCSPLIGSVILEYYDYTMVLGFLILYASLCFFGILFTKETHLDRTPLSTQSAKRDLKVLFSDNIFIRSMILCGCFYAIIPIYDTIGGFLLTEVYDYTVLEFGYTEIILATAWLMGNLINRFLTHQSVKRITSIAYLISFTTLFIGILISILWKESDMLLFITLSIVVASIAVLFPLHLGIALVNHKKIAGLANAILFSGCSIIASIVTNFSTVFSTDSSLTIYGLIAGTLGIAFIVFIAIQPEKTDGSVVIGPS